MKPMTKEKPNIENCPPGHWFRDGGEYWIRIRFSRRCRGFIAATYKTAERSWPGVRIEVVNAKNVLGIYPTIDDARRAAKYAILMTDEDRLCTPRDIDRVRKEMRRG